MSHLRLIYHYRKVAARSHAESELDYYADPDMSWQHGNVQWSDSFDRSGTGHGAWASTLATAKWNDGPILYEVTMDTPDGEKLLDLRILS